MAKVKFAVFFLVVAGACAWFLIQQREQARLRTENGSLRKQIEESVRLAAENEQLSNQLAQAAHGVADHTSELLKLRGEVTTLRKATNEMPRLREQNERLLAARTVLENSRRAPPDAAPEDIHPKETWFNAGYTTPENTVGSLFWAASQTNLETLLAAFAPEMRQEIAKHLKEEDLARDAGRIMSGAVDWRIVKRTIVSDDQVVLNIYINGAPEENPQPMHLIRIDGQWKLTEKGRDGVPDSP